MCLVCLEGGVAEEVLAVVYVCMCVRACVPCVCLSNQDGVWGLIDGAHDARLARRHMHIHKLLALKLCPSGVPVLFVLSPFAICTGAAEAVFRDCTQPPAARTLLGCA